MTARRLSLVIVLASVAIVACRGRGQAPAPAPAPAREPTHLTATQCAEFCKEAGKVVGAYRVGASFPFRRNPPVSCECVDPAPAK